MWHEALSDRGADQIASCPIKCLENLPDTVKKVILYFDSCSRQNKNNVIAGASSHFVHKSPNVAVIECKFLEIGHTRIECDADHAKIKWAKKFSNIEIRIPHYWYSLLKLCLARRVFRLLKCSSRTFYHILHYSKASMWRWTKLLLEETLGDMTLEFWAS